MPSKELYLPRKEIIDNIMEIDFDTNQNLDNLFNESKGRFLNAVTECVKNIRDLVTYYYSLSSKDDMEPRGGFDSNRDPTKNFRNSMRDILRLLDYESHKVFKEENNPLGLHNSYTVDIRTYEIIRNKLYDARKILLNAKNAIKKNINRQNELSTEWMNIIRGIDEIINFTYSIKRNIDDRIP